MSTVYTFTVGSITWNYTLTGNNASIGNGTTNFGNATTLGTGLTGAITIPAALNGYPVTSIGNSAFRRCTLVTSFTIPNSVTSIASLAFAQCTSLTSVTISDSVTFMGDYAFYACSGLTSVTIGNSVTSIDIYTFYECTSLTSVTIGNSVTSIASASFQYCSVLTSVIIPNSVTSIGTSAFSNTSANLVITMSDGKFGKTVPSTNQTFFGNTSVDFVLPPPTMTITSTTAGVTSGSTTNNETIALTFTSSASTTNFLAGDISLTNGTLSPLAGSGTVYTATFTPTGQGACTINVAAGVFTAAGQNNTASNTFTWTFDSVSPSMTITSTTAGVTSGSTTNNETIALTFTSTEATTNFVVGDITVTNGTLSPLDGSGAVYTATFTPTGQGACTIDVAAGAYTDAATNLNNLAAQFTWTFDSVPPTMTITSTTAGVTSGSTTNNETIELIFTSSKPTTNFVVGDITVTNGAISNFAGSGTVYTATFTPTGQGACTIDVAAGAFTDAAGNSTSATTFNWTFDSVSPSMIITSTTDGVAIGSATNNETIALTFTSTEATNNFGEGDITVTNGALTNFAGSGAVYTATFTPTGEGACTIGVAAGAYTDAAGNSNIAATTFNWTFEINDYGNSTPTALSFVNNTLTVLNRIDSADADKVSFDVTAGSLLYSLKVTSLLNANSISYVLDISGGSTVSSGSFTQAGVDLLNGNVLEQATNTTYILTLTSGGSNAYSIIGKSLDAGYKLADMLSVGYIPNFAAFNEANKLEQTYIMGFLDVSGEIIQRSGNLTVTDGNLLVNTGDVSFNTGKLYVVGNVSMNSTMTVAGATKVTRVAASGNLAVGGATALDGTLTIANATVFNDNVSIANNNAFIVGSGATTIGGIASMNSQLTVAEDVFMNSTLNVLGATTLTNVSIDGDLISSGKTVFLNDASFNVTTVDICGNLYAQYPASTIPASAVNVGGSIFQTDVTINSTLNVAGATTMSSIIASGSAAVGGTLVVVGATTLSTLNTTNNAAVGGTLVVSGKTTSSGDISFNGSIIDICGNLYANYPANSIPVAAIISDNSSIFNTDVSMNSGLNIVGATTLSSSVASGKTRFSSDVSMNGSRIDICGNLYANYASSSIPQSAIVGGIGSLFTTDVTMNTRLYVRDRITLGSATLQYKDTWQKEGADIDGEAFEDESGYSVAISSDGSIVAISGWKNNGTSGSDRGSVRVYQRNATNTTINPIGWTQLGRDIDGETTAIQSGSSVSLSGNGSIVAIGSYLNDGTIANTSDNRGSVQIYQIDLSNTALGWQKVGGDIDGEASGDVSAASVSLSSDGMIVAIGAQNNDGTSGTSTDNRGHVRVYKRDASNNTVEPHGWIQLGQDIDGEARGDQSGLSVSLSGNGSTVAIGTVTNDGTTTNTGDERGHVRVYRIDLSNTALGWTKLGNDIDGDAKSDFSGRSVSLSSDGTIIAIGADGNDGTTINVNDDRGHVRIYRIDLSNTALGWRQLGNDIDGEATIDGSGQSVSLSGDGSIVAIGARLNDGTTGNASDNRGHVRVYIRDLSTNIWRQWGPDIDGETAGDQFGHSVALSSDGLSVAIGAIYNDGTTGLSTDNRGSVRIYKRDINVPVNGLYVDRSLVATDVSLGTLSIGSTLGITGATTLTTLTVAGNSSVGGTLAITGATTTTSFVSSGSATLGGTLAVTGSTTFATDVSLNPKLIVGRDVSMNSRLFVGGDVSMNSKVFVGGDVSMNSALSIVGATTLTNTTINSTLNVTGATTVQSLNVVSNLTGTTIVVTGQSILNGDVSMNTKLIVGGNVSMNSKLSVSGATTISALNVTSNAIVGGTLAVTGKTRFSTDVSMNSTALVAGDVSLNSNLTVATNTAIGGTLRVTGATTASSTLAVTGATTIGGTLDVAGKTAFAANATFNGNLDISGDLSVKGNTILALANIITEQNWGQLGGDIDGEAASDQSGYSVSLSSNGLFLAIGAIKNSTRGHVQVYQRNISNTTISPIGWTKLGNDIDFDGSGGDYGTSVSLSSDGTIVAVGGPVAERVRVFKIISNVWTQLGGDILGGISDNLFGTSVSLSGDGSIVAIGAYRNDGTNAVTNDDRGRVVVYKLISNVWTQLGGIIYGEAAYDTSGRSVSMSTDGSTVAIGAYQNDGSVAGSDRGSVRVYKIISNVWTQSGGDIDGESSTDWSGYSVALSSDGSIVAIGARSNDGTSGADRGHVRVYKNISNVWTKVGGDIDGEANSDLSGRSVSLSSDGSTVAIGAIWNDGTSSSSIDNRGHVRVYKNISNVWTKLGMDIDGEAALDESGISVSLSSDGSILAIGANKNDGLSGQDSGSVRVYYFPPTIYTYTNAPLVSTDLITTGNTTVSGPLSVTSSTAISSTLNVSGATTLTSLTTSRNAAFGSTLQVTGATTMTTLQVTGATTLTSLAATGNAVFGGTLVVTGATTMSSLNVSGLIKKR